MTPLARTVLVLCALSASAARAAENKTTLPTQSPFTSTATVAPATASGETLELAGISGLGKKTDLILYDRNAKKSYWIAVGETKEGISVLNYDARREQAVVKINGAEKVLTLRKGTGPVNSPTPVGAMPTGFNVVSPALPAAPAPAPQPITAAPTPPDPTATPKLDAAPMTPQAKAEMEARMLVSDLLEIGMAQRKAYEDAQRRASQGQPSNAQGQPATNEQPVQQPAPAEPPRP